eukprot:485856-Lingulodinium_polyedra.AAC.1
MAPLPFANASPQEASPNSLATASAGPTLLSTELLHFMCCFLGVSNLPKTIFFFTCCCLILCGSLDASEGLASGTS